MNEYQYIEIIESFYDYVTNTWIDDDALFDSVFWNYCDFKSLRTNNLPVKNFPKNNGIECVHEDIETFLLHRECVLRL